MVVFTTFKRDALVQVPVSWCILTCLEQEPWSPSHMGTDILKSRGIDHVPSKLSSPNLESSSERIRHGGDLAWKVAKPLCMEVGVVGEFAGEPSKALTSLAIPSAHGKDVTTPHKLQHRIIHLFPTWAQGHNRGDRMGLDGHSTPVDDRTGCLLSVMALHKTP